MNIQVSKKLDKKIPDKFKDNIVYRNGKFIIYDEAFLELKKCGDIYDAIFELGKYVQTLEPKKQTCPVCKGSGIVDNLKTFKTADEFLGILSNKFLNLLFP